MWAGRSIRRPSVRPTAQLRTVCSLDYPNYERNRLFISILAQPLRATWGRSNGKSYRTFQATLFLEDGRRVLHARTAGARRPARGLVSRKARFGPGTVPFSGLQASRGLSGPLSGTETAPLAFRPTRVRRRPHHRPAAEPRQIGDRGIARVRLASRTHLPTATPHFLTSPVQNYTGLFARRIPAQPSPEV